eukprot:CAMPEP_0184754254 /NCGR_PEP_ID=MMETSP0315-20130426/44521_1 /TAXON_ID=101924 /ORGANISM="Rhodosorus marinus, Strain UTEX LB 2760" /LENGTH=64 /DNA_ID=CAMNT_0027233661 /DNA_START=1538 /DNA_END=1732 /DNA_ORIENTATION=+
MASSFGNKVLGRLAKSSKAFDGKGYKLEVIMITDGIPIFRSFPGFSVGGRITRLTGGSSKEMGP